MVSFDEMLDNLYTELNKCSLNKITLHKPIIVGKSKPVWVNAKNFLKDINRNPDHFINFLSKNSNGDVNWKSQHKSEGIIFGFKINETKLKNIMQEYIKKYVSCNQCNSCNTKFEKDVTIRKNKVICSDCNSERYV